MERAIMAASLLAQPLMALLFFSQKRARTLLFFKEKE
jgi:hypothetical protein